MKIDRKIKELIIHCTGTPEGRDVTVTQIDEYHHQIGFQSIGYHYVIYRDGSVHQGRPLEVPGAHCKGHNYNSIGICYVGGLTADGKRPKDTRTAPQRVALRELVAYLRHCFPEATVHGHNEFAAKDCPCFDVQKSDLVDL